MTSRRSSPKIIVTIPAYNEEKTLGGILAGIKAVMRRKGYRFALQVVDDGSTDRTVAIARAAGAAVYCHPKNYGLARAFTTEVEKAVAHGADIIVHTDADGQYAAEDIPKLIEEVRHGSDLVLGSRFMGTIEAMPFINRLGNIAFSSVISRIVRMHITDAQTGFRAFTRETAQKIPITSNYTYTHEQLIRAERLKLRISEVPVTAKKTRKSRLMKSPLDYAIKAWITLIRLYRDYEPLSFFGIIGGTLLAVGVAIGLFIIYTLITTGSVGGIPRTILSALLVLTGIQIISFGFLADMQRR